MAGASDILVTTKKRGRNDAIAPETQQTRTNAQTEDKLIPDANRNSIGKGGQMQRRTHVFRYCDREHVQNAYEEETIAVFGQRSDLEPKNTRRAERNYPWGRTERDYPGILDGRNALSLGTSD